MDHACGLALMRRVGLALFALGFALMSVPLALHLAQVPDMVAREEAMRAVYLSDAEFKGGGWRAGEFEMTMQSAGVRVASVGNFAMLVGLAFLAYGAWRARDEPEGRRTLRATAALLASVVGFGLLMVVARRLLDPAALTPLHALQAGATFGALALLAAARGSRLALVLGAGAALVQFVTRMAFFGPDLAWLHEASLHAFFGAKSLLLWASYVLMAAAFAAGAATLRPPSSPATAPVAAYGA